MSTEKNKDQLLQGIAKVAAGFALLVCILVIANYFQVNRLDPVNTEVINSLVERLNENPQDEDLRTQIRELDLLARKAYFTNQWQVKMGGYLILLALAVFVIAYQLMDSNKRKQVQSNPDQPKDILGIQKNARLGIAIVGGALVFVALFMAFFMHTQLGDRIKNKTKPVVQETENIIEHIEELTQVDEQEEIISVTTEESPSEEVGKNIKSEDQTVKIKEEETLTKEPEPKTKTIKAYPSQKQLKDNFTTFRGYNSNGIVYHKNIPTDWDGPSGRNILWKSEIPVHGYNSPIIWENKVFVSGANETQREVFCFDANTGKLLWQSKIKDIPGSPEKAPKTTPDTGLAAATMTTNGKYVFVIFGTGDIVALDMNGKMVWGINLGVPQNHYGHSSSLIMFEDNLIVQYDQKKNSQIMALNAQTGEKVWSTPRDVKVSWASPILVEHKGETHIITAADPYVASYNPKTGQENWKLDCIYGEVGPSVAYFEGKVFALNEYASLAAIDMDNPTEVLWEDDMVLSDIPSPVATKRLLFVSTSYGLVACYDAITGQSYWEQEFGNSIYASPMVVGEHIYLMDIKGGMHIFKADKAFTKLTTLALGEDAFATPAFANGRIYIRGNKNLYCIGK